MTKISVTVDLTERNLKIIEMLLDKNTKEPDQWSDGAPEEFKAQAPWEDKEPTSTPDTTPDRETIRGIAVGMIRNGHRDEVMELIKQYSPETGKIPGIPDKDLPVFYKALLSLEG